MRIRLMILASVFFLSARSQSFIPAGNLDYMQRLPLPGSHFTDDSLQHNQKWYFSKYAGVSAGFSFFNGGSATYISAPFVLQLNHPLNENVTAFAAVTAAPTFFSFNNAFTHPTAGKYYPGSYLPNTYSFGMDSRVEMGLMYTNDAHTFSISGSIGVERSSYPIFPVEPPRSPVNRK